MRILYGSGKTHHYSETKHVLWMQPAKELGRIVDPKGEPISIWLDREVISFGFQSTTDSE